MISDWVDAVLVKTLATTKGKRQLPSKFCSAHKAALALLMKDATHEQVIAHEGSWEDIEEPLLELVNGSLVGSKLFQAASTKVIWVARKVCT